MFNIIKRYMENLTIEQVNNFAISKNINLTEDELTFTHAFVVKNWEKILGNPNLLHLERYKNKFSEENFIKITKLFNEYSTKYHNYL